MLSLYVIPYLITKVSTEPTQILSARLPAYIMNYSPPRTAVQGKEKKSPTYGWIEMRLKRAGIFGCSMAT